MKKFVTAKYQIESEKIHTPFTVVMVSDLHNVVFGEKNQRLLEQIRRIKPDLLAVAGDLVLGKPGASLREPEEFLREGLKIAPVFYAPGNHEQRMKLYPETYGRDYLSYEKRIQRMGVRLLKNRTERIRIKDQDIAVTGLELPYEYYLKRKQKNLEKRELTRLLGKPEKYSFQILLAHTPKYGQAYLEWGGDLIFSGHYHGGMVRLPFLGGMISPDLRLFPRFCRGKFTREDRYLIVGAGLGEHTIPVRLFNPRELVVVSCLPKKKQEKGTTK